MLLGLRASEHQSRRGSPEGGGAPTATSLGANTQQRCRVAHAAIKGPCPLEIQASPGLCGQN